MGAPRRNFRWKNTAAVLLLLHSGAVSRAGPSNSPAAAGAPPVETTHPVWGDPVDGIRIRLVVDQTTIEAGRTLGLKIEIENAGTVPRRLAISKIYPFILPTHGAAEPLPDYMDNLVVTADRYPEGLWSGHARSQPVELVVVPAGSGK
jgi:hypothetical protein